MKKQLDLMDIQGNVLRAYGRYNFPLARYVFINIHDGARGREFLKQVTKRVTTAVSWGEGPDPIQKPLHTLNVAFTYQGLKALELPRASLIGFPMEFVMGMRPRADILGDDNRSAPEYWDPIWRDSRHRDRHKDVHAWLAINAQTPAALHDGYEQLLKLVHDTAGGVQVLTGHRGDDGKENLAYQDVHVLFEDGKPTSKEHFGYTDGIGDPVFEGMPSKPERVVGRGKQMKDGTWAPLETGEFILGHRDEAQEYPIAPAPQLLSRNGTFMVYRKLHENVGSFNKLLEEEGDKYPGGKELLAAKFVGRWRDNGAPLVSAPDATSKAAWDARFSTAAPLDKDKMLSGFTFDNDMQGGKCPFSAHIRRINPRASLEFTKGAFDTPGALSNRRRVLRRGLPYGQVKDPTRDDGNHGIIIMMLNASISRQFEFVQQQWINYGNDFHASNEKDVILGNHGDDDAPSRAVIQVEPDSDDAPYILKKIPRLVETRGGDYFFVPSMTALRMMAQGIVDPT
ncbi:Dyp-type peroxidase [Oxalicibacterium faecigallinarum]|uniref:Dyp-type peroxidase n=1 Tax=Oxalicibacterium faecigallinarum TaxID=573741 RepID=UPI00166D6EAB|nr:peroxidase [Oxalicibacterium faecigallinarum]